MEVVLRAVRAAPIRWRREQSAIAVAAESSLPLMTSSFWLAFGLRFLGIHGGVAGLVWSRDGSHKTQLVSTFQD